MTLLATPMTKQKDVKSAWQSFYLRQSLCNCPCAEGLTSIHCREGVEGELELIYEYDSATPSNLPAFDEFYED